MSMFLISCAHNPPTARTLNKYFKSTVQIIVTSQGHGHSEGKMIRWSGTGFSVATDGSSSTILTNKHVCGGDGSQRQFIVMDYSGKRYSARWVRSDALADLCIIKTDAIIESVVLAKKNPVRGTHIVVVGAPLGLFPNFTDGFISGYYPLDMVSDEYETHARVAMTSVAIYPGNSGSGAFNDDGKLVGIFFAGSSDAEHITFLVPVETINMFLDDSQDVFER